MEGIGKEGRGEGERQNGEGRGKEEFGDSALVVRVDAPARFRHYMYIPCMRRSICRKVCRS